MCLNCGLCLDCCDCEEDYDDDDDEGFPTGDPEGD